MMNKKRTKEIGRTKYLMILPLAALLMIVSNIEMVARTTEKFAKEIMGQETTQTVVQPETVAVPELPAEKIAEVTPPQVKKAVPAPQIKSVPDSTIFEVVEEMPEFPGGQQALMEYISKNLRYPAEARAKGIQGRVIVSFVVKKDGSIEDTEVVRSIEPSIDKEAQRVISSMPKWKPGKQRGQAVNVKFTVPLVFRLPDAPKAEEIKATDLSEVVVVAYAPKEEVVEARKAEAARVVKVAEVMPKFPGGTQGLMQYLARNIKYPTIAQENKEQGKVVLKMVIGTDGRLSNIKIIESVSPELDIEAMRVVKGMPKWEPGLQDGKPVPVEYTLPVTFRLQ